MKKVIIIGASSGIGKALAEIFSKNGYEVGLTARRVELLKEIQSKLSVKSYVKYMDLLKPEDSIKGLEELIKGMGGVDIIVINSGVGYEAKKLEFVKERAAIDVNVLGFTAMAVAATNYFEDKGTGHIVGISSIAAIRPFRQAPAYGASKAFISFYLKGLRHKFINQGKDIFVTDILPGFVCTDLTKGNEHMFWISTAEKSASQIYQAIVKRKRTAYITKRWHLIALFLKIIPDFIYNRI
ncbi:MAG: SDR family NAD(P)-dependent oxidoreductase [bacterium]